MTRQLNTDNGLQGRWTKTTGYNSTYPKGGFSCSKDSFVVNHPPAGGFQIKLRGKSPALRVAVNRYLLPSISAACSPKEARSALEGSLVIKHYKAIVHLTCIKRLRIVINVFKTASSLGNSPYTKFLKCAL